jgi:hypothetical protein
MQGVPVTALLESCRRLESVDAFDNINNHREMKSSDYGNEVPGCQGFLSCRLAIERPSQYFRWNQQYLYRAHPIKPAIANKERLNIKCPDKGSTVLLAILYKELLATGRSPERLLRKLAQILSSRGEWWRHRLQKVGGFVRMASPPSF